MGLFHNILTVAKYEARTLRRSWFFRLFTLGALFIFSIMNMALFSPIGEEQWDFVSFPASVPMVNLYILNLAQSVLVIFLASDFMRRDKKLDTNEVLYTRPVSNFEYITGKSLGILRLFIGFDIIILMIGLLMNLISGTMDVDPAAYIEYLALICVPTIVFSLGLAFMMMSLIKNQAVTFLLLLGFAAANVFWLWHRMGMISDYMAFGLPMMKSTIIGFDDPGFIVCHRFQFFSLGIAFIMATILLFNRLPQSKVHMSITTVLLVVFMAAGSLCAFRTYSVYESKVNDKKTVLATNRKYEDQLFASIRKTSLQLEHRGENLSASVDLTFENENDSALDRYYFSLNPSLEVKKVSSAGKDLRFERDFNILIINPERPLAPGESDSLEIVYEGTINESFCYPGSTGSLRDDEYRIDPLSVGKRQAFVTDRYVLLTPETHWYPVASLNYYPSNPAKGRVDFTTFTLRATTSVPGLVVVSQGKMEMDGDTFCYSPSSPLTGLTVAIGDYHSGGITVDSVEFITWFYPGHDYYTKDLNLLADTLSYLVKGLMREMETNFSTVYPFKTLSLVEVPVQFHSKQKKNTQTRAETQPSMVLLPEKLSTLDQAGFSKSMTRMKRNNLRNNQVVTDKELQVRMFNAFIRNLFISVQNYRYNNGVLSDENTRYLMGPGYYYFKNHFWSAEYPVINAVFESHLQKLENSNRDIMPLYEENISENDRANIILRDISFRELLKKNPGNDTLRAVLTLKGDYLFNLLRSRAGIKEFNDWFRSYVESNSFRRIGLRELSNAISEKFGFDFYPMLEEWYNSNKQPGFMISDVRASQIVINDRTRFLISFMASNPEPVAGLFNAAIRTGSDEGGSNISIRADGQFISMQGRGMETGDISRIVFLSPLEAKRISLITDVEPRELLINTLFSSNLPGELILPVGEVRRTKGLPLTTADREEIAKMPVFDDASEIIVDNEDRGFDPGPPLTVSPLRRLLGVKNGQKEEYKQVSLLDLPSNWQPVINSSFYGKYVRSAVYTRAGTGDRSVKWTGGMKGPGFYEVYCYTGKTSDRMVVRYGGRSSDQGSGPYRDHHYRISHDQGMEEITLDHEVLEEGWNLLGRYYISSDSATVELSNKSEGRLVTGDAVKWVKTD